MALTEIQQTKASVKINHVPTDADVQTLFNNGSFNPGEIIVTPDEDVNLSQMRTKVLWTNQNPNSTFASQTITLNSSYYDFLIFISDFFVSSSIATQRNTISMTLKGRGCSLNAAADYGGSEATFYRTATYTSDTQYNISGGSYRCNTTLSNDNSVLVPVQVIGLYKTPAMIYTGTELNAGNGVSISNGTISSKNLVPLASGSINISAPTSTATPIVWQNTTGRDGWLYAVLADKDSVIYLTTSTSNSSSSLTTEGCILGTTSSSAYNSNAAIIPVPKNWYCRIKCNGSTNFEQCKFIPSQGV